MQHLKSSTTALTVWKCAELVLEFCFRHHFIPRRLASHKDIGFTDRDIICLVLLCYLQQQIICELMVREKGLVKFRLVKLSMCLNHSLELYNKLFLKVSSVVLNRVPLIIACVWSRPRHNLLIATASLLEDQNISHILLIQAKISLSTLGGCISKSTCCS